MNDTATSSATSSAASAPEKNDHSAAKPAAKAATKTAPATKAPVKARGQSAKSAPKSKTVKATGTAVKAPATPAKAKTTPANAGQTKTLDKKKSPAPTKVVKEKKVKVVRDSFTLPKTELLQINDMKKRAMALGVEVKKSELIRAGLQALAGMADTAFKKAMSNVPTIKTGRPAKD
jgi:hypothetical protein